MPILVLIVTGLVALISGIMLVTIIPGLLRVVRAEYATPDRTHALDGGEVSLRGRAVPIEGQDLVSWFSGQALVWRRIEISERVGKRSHVVWEDVYRRPFLLDDGHGRIVIQPGECRVDNATVGGGGGRQHWPKHLRAYVDEHAHYRYPNTPKRAMEYTLPVDTIVTLRGEAVLTAQPDGGAVYVVHADHIAPYGGGLLRTEEGRVALGSLVGLLVGLAGSAACWWWGVADGAW